MGQSLRQDPNSVQNAEPNKNEKIKRMHPCATVVDDAIRFVSSSTRRKHLQVIAMKMTKKNQLEEKQEEETGGINVTINRFSELLNGFELTVFITYYVIEQICQKTLLNQQQLLSKFVSHTSTSYPIVFNKFTTLVIHFLSEACYPHIDMLYFCSPNQSFESVVELCSTLI